MSRSRRSLAFAQLHLTTHRTWMKRVMMFVLVTAVYAVAAILTLRFGKVEGSASPLWPPTGIGLAALVLLGWDMAPAIFFGSMLAGAATNAISMSLLGISFANLLEGLAGYCLLLLVGNFSPGLRRVRDVSMLLLLGAIGGGLVGATVGTATMYFTGRIASAVVFENWLAWWVGDALGVMVVGSAVMVLASHPKTKVLRKHYVELATIAVLLMSSSYIVFARSTGFMRPVSYVVFACVVWSALRFQQLGAVLAGMCATAVAVGAALVHLESSLTVPLLEQVAQLQGSIAVLTVTGLLMAAVMSERNEAMEELRETEFTLRSANTERKRSFEELLEREAALRSVAEAIPQLVWSTNAEGVLEYCNSRCCEYTGLTQKELSGLCWESVVHPEDKLQSRGKWMRSLESGDVYECEYRLQRGSDKTYRWFLSRGVPLRDANGQVLKWFGTCTDIHDQKQQEEVLRRTEKLAATGRLAATIAHEINNPLAAVSNLLYLLKRDPTLLPTARDYVKLADAELLRVTHIARQTLMFYRDSTAPMPLDITEVVDGVLALYGQKLKLSKVTIERRYECRISIRTVPGEIRQVISNLVVNAIEAMTGGGKIVVHVREGRSWRKPEVKGVRICICDDGPGIAHEHLQEIFEPFFTTKGEKGTGLGLWVTQGLIVKNGGSTRVRSRTSGTNTGSIFSVFLPLEMDASLRRHQASA